jgi:hypothetical protein
MIYQVLYNQLAKSGSNEAIMKIMPNGDYYIWYCDWCDSRNLTLWTRIDKMKVVCAACYTLQPITDPPLMEERHC